MLNSHRVKFRYVLVVLLIGVLVWALVHGRTASPDAQTRESAVAHALECIVEDPPFPLTESLHYYEQQLLEEWGSIGEDTDIATFKARMNLAYPGCFD